MELQYYGANCVKITTKKAAIVVDDNLELLGLKAVTRAGDIALNTHDGIPEHETRFTASMPGEYETANVSIVGIAARAHMDEEGKKTAVIYRLNIEDIRIVILGHTYPDLSEQQLEEIGMIDILVIPVGGMGYTLDGLGALKLIKKIEPKVIIPTHFADKAIKYEVPQQSLSEALKAMSMEPSETLPKYRPKASEMNDVSRLIVLERQ